MMVLDAYGVVAYLRDEAAGAAVDDLLKNPHGLLGLKCS